MIAALLTLVGYSMNDTIVIFDRIRENLQVFSGAGSFRRSVNASINQTLSRTILTSGLTFLTALSLFLFGGPVLNGFSFALVVVLSLGPIRRSSSPARFCSSGRIWSNVEVRRPRPLRRLGSSGRASR